MKIFVALFTTSLGKKYLMALTGAGLFLFALGHMVGNLQVFLGREQINAYGHFLQHTPELVWPARFGLLAMLAVHIWAALKLTLENRAARPVAYAVKDPAGASLASRTLIVTGLVIASFVVYHLLHFTFRVGAINLTGQDFRVLVDDQGRHDIFKMMVVGYSHPVVVVFYILSIGLLCFHLSHGVSSMFQSLGLKNRAYDRLIDRAAKVASALIFLGYSSIPAAIWLGYGKD
jgi:succinate dehydrogenase / fumarate reductase cytochrome b subunit